MLDELLKKIAPKAGIEPLDVQEVYQLIDQIEPKKTDYRINVISAEEFANRLVEMFSLHEYEISLRQRILPFIQSRGVSLVVIESENNTKKLGVRYKLDQEIYLVVDISDEVSWSVAENFDKFDFHGTELILISPESQISLNSLFPGNEIEVIDISIADIASELELGNFDYNPRYKKLGISKVLTSLSSILTILHEAGHAWARKNKKLNSIFGSVMHMRSFFAPKVKPLEKTDEEFLRELVYLKADEVLANLIAQKICKDKLLKLFPQILNASNEDMIRGLNSYDSAFRMSALHSARILGINVDSLFLFPEKHLNEIFETENKLQQLKIFIEYLIDKFNFENVNTKHEIKIDSKEYGKIALVFEKNIFGEINISFSSTDFDGFYLFVYLGTINSYPNLFAKLVDPNSAKSVDGSLGYSEDCLPISLYTIVTFIIESLNEFEV